jgi:MFS family permease
MSVDGQSAGTALTAREIRATAALAGVFAMRLLGLFMIYPVFEAYARHLDGATPVMIGMALGAYGLTQGLFQIPFGLLSDRIGRKAVISIGFVLFGTGSVIAALSTSITGVLIGRILQGMGAIGSVVLAMVADYTRDDVRTKAMAVVGMTIGLSFLVAIGIGPVLDGLFGVPGIFWLTAGLAVVGIAITYSLPPAPAHVVPRRDAEAVPALFARILGNGELLRLDVAVFALHAILTASFLAVPPLLTSSLHLAADRDWQVYVPVLLASVVLMVPAIIVAEKSRRMKEIFIAAIVLIGASQVALAIAGSRPAVSLTALVVFFTGFNVMEAMLPSLVTKIAPAGAKGTATGIFSTAQFLGIFAGGAIGGWAWSRGGSSGAFEFAIAASVVWLVVAATMRRPGQYTNYVARLNGTNGQDPGALAAHLQALPGVIEVVVARDEGVAYLKIDRARFDAAAVARVVGG